MTKAELQAVLDCDNKPFIRAMGDAVRRQKSAGKMMQSNWKGVGTAFAGIAGGMGVPLGFAAAAAGATAMGRSVLHTASDVQDMADAVGLSTDQFQKFSFALEQAGGDGETLTKSMMAIIQKMDEAQTEGGKLVKDFEKIGVSAHEIGKISNSEVLLRMADHLSKSNDKAEATADVMEIIGSKLARKTVPALKDGRQAFLEMGNSATIMEAQSISALDGIGDKLHQFKKSMIARVGNNAAELFGALFGFGGGNKGAKGPPEMEPTIMEPVTVEAKEPRSTFWQKEYPKFKSRLAGGDEFEGLPDWMLPTQRDPETGRALKFRGFAPGYFPTQSAALQTGGLTTGSLSTGSLSGSAYGRVRKGDAARAKAEAQASKDPSTAVAENTAKLVEIWGGTGKRK